MALLVVVDPSQEFSEKNLMADQHVFFALHVSKLWQDAVRKRSSPPTKFTKFHRGETCQQTVKRMLQQAELRHSLADHYDMMLAFVVGACVR